MGERQAGGRGAAFGGDGRFIFRCIRNSVTALTREMMSREGASEPEKALPLMVNKQQVMQQ